MHPLNSVRWSVSIAAICFNLCVLAPIFLYFFYRFLHKRHHVVISKRYPKIVCAINILTIWMLLVQRSVHILLNLSPLRDHKLYVLATAWNVAFWAPSAIPFLYLGRFWLMFYDLNHGNSTLNSRWKHYLDSNLIDGDFWTRNYNTFGSTSCVLKISMIAWFFCTLLWSVPYQISVQNGQIWNVGIIYMITMLLLAFVHLLCAFICTILWCRVPHIRDLLYLRYELKIMVIIVNITILLMLTTISAQFIVNNMLNSDRITYTLQAMVAVFGSITYFLYGITSTIFILYKIESNERNTDTREQSVSQSWKQHTTISISEPNLYEILMDKEYFELFVQHSVREFNTEMILCLVELQQFRQVLKSNFPKVRKHKGMYNTLSYRGDDDIDHENVELKEHDHDFEKCVFSRNSSIPKSETVYSKISAKNKSELGVYMAIAVELFNKYINNKNGCNIELTINISGELRNRFMVPMLDGDKWIQRNKNLMSPRELYHLFDDIMDEIYHQLLMIFDRFLQSNIQINIARLLLEKQSSTDLAKKMYEDNM